MSIYHPESVPAIKPCPDEEAIDVVQQHNAATTDQAGEDGTEVVTVHNGDIVSVRPSRQGNV